MVEQKKLSLQSSTPETAQEGECVGLSLARSCPTRGIGPKRVSPYYGGFKESKKKGG